MILDYEQIIVIGRLTDHINGPIEVNDTNMNRVVAVQSYYNTTAGGYVYLVGSDGTTVRVGGAGDNLVAVDNQDFHVKGVDWSTDGCECPDAEGETCPRHGSPGDVR